MSVRIREGVPFRTPLVPRLCSGLTAWRNAPVQLLGRNINTVAAKRSLRGSVVVTKRLSSGLMFSRPWPLTSSISASQLQSNTEFLLVVQLGVPLDLEQSTACGHHWFHVARVRALSLLLHIAPAMSVAIQTSSSLFVSTCNAQRRPARCVVWNSSLLRGSWCSAAQDYWPCRHYFHC